MEYSGISGAILFGDVGVSLLVALAVFDDAGVSPLNKGFLKIILFIEKHACSPNGEVLAFVPPLSGNRYV